MKAAKHGIRSGVAIGILKPYTLTDIHPPRKLPSPPALRGWGNQSVYGPFGPGLCGMLDPTFGE
jgi:hypothetical protein